MGDLFSARHSLHRKVTDAKGFYAVYCGLIVIAAAIVLTPGSPLGLLTLAVQVLAGVLLPSATVFLLLLCNDKAVIRHSANARLLDLFAGAVIAVLVILSVILTTTLSPDATNEQVILGILGGGGVVSVVVALAIMALSQSGARTTQSEATVNARISRVAWRMPPLDQLPRRRLFAGGEDLDGRPAPLLVIASSLVEFRVVMLAIGQN